MTAFMNDEEFTKHLLLTFRIEAEEHIHAMSLMLIELENPGTAMNDSELMESIFREAHSLKGASRAVNLREFELLCHALESLFSSMKKTSMARSAALFDLLHRGVDYLDQRLNALESDPTPIQKNEHGVLLKGLSEATRDNESQDTGIKLESPTVSPPSDLDPVGKDVTIPSETSKPVHTSVDTLRVSASRLSTVLLQSEEMLTAKLSAAQRVHDMREIQSSLTLWKQEWGMTIQTVRTLRERYEAGKETEQMTLDSGEIRNLGRLLDFGDWNREFNEQTEMAFTSLMKALKQDRLALDSMVNTLLRDMKKITMLPFSSMLESMPKVVRDLSRDYGREVDLEIQGDELEIDRRILDEMRDPMIHLLRNCIDHGIEKPHERLSKNKSRRGKISISIIPRDHKVEVILSDDGRGISGEKIRGAMIKAGNLSIEQGEALSEQELAELAFYSGVSTSPIITDISGRGLGLAIVREKVDKLGGCIHLVTKPDAGTRFHILLPLTVAIFRGILVTAGGQEFVIPTMYVEQVLRIPRRDVKTVENLEIILLEDAVVSLVRLSGVLGMKEATDQREAMHQIILLGAADVRAAFIVDRINNEKEVLFKDLGPLLSHVRNIAGATVLGTGSVVPVINVPDLLKSAVNRSSHALDSVGLSSLETREVVKKTVLVVEDSITTRTFLKNILESAGYGVHTAVDGVEAMDYLKGNRCDIVLTDVEMPRMNGFELTRRIRGDSLIRGMPVILITALTSTEDQERGMDVGANAYIVKNQFDQSNLLDILKKLVS